MEYQQTWRQRVTPSGSRFWEHTASARRISASDFTGWPTPQAKEQLEDSESKVARGMHAGLNLAVAASLTGWPTPNASPDAPNMSKTREGGRIASRNTDQSLGVIARGLTGWPSPNCNTRGPKSNESKDSRGSGGIDLQSTALLSGPAASAATPSIMPSLESTDAPTVNLTGWSTPTLQDAANCAGPSQWKRNSQALNVQAHGPISTSSTAATGKPGALDPGLPRWLMGFPPEWCACAVTAMPSSPPSRRSSSKLAKKP
jgi:hypothetical protein